MREPESNAEFLDHLITFSKYNPIIQLFIINAVAEAAEQLAEVPLEDFRQKCGPNSFIHPDAWHAAARELHDELVKRGVN